MSSAGVGGSDLLEDSAPSLRRTDGSLTSHQAKHRGAPGHRGTGAPELRGAANGSNLAQTSSDQSERNRRSVQTWSRRADHGPVTGPVTGPQSASRSNSTVCLPSGRFVLNPAVCLPSVEPGRLAGYRLGYRLG